MLDTRCRIADDGCWILKVKSKYSKVKKGSFPVSRSYFLFFTFEFLLVHTFSLLIPLPRHLNMFNIVFQVYFAGLNKTQGGIKFFEINLGAYAYINEAK